MPSALKEIGIWKAFKYFYTTFLGIFYKAMIFPQMRVAFLRLCGAKIGKNTIICSGVRFLNLYRTGLRGLTIGNYCWISEEAMLDLADKIDIGDHVGLGQRSMITTHLNVGYSDHPLQGYFPAHQKPVVIQDGVFIGPYCVIMPGVTVGGESFIIAKSMVARDVPSGVMYGGIPGKVVQKIDKDKER